MIRNMVPGHMASCSLVDAETMFTDGGSVRHRARRNRRHDDSPIFKTGPFSSASLADWVTIFE